MILRVMEFSIFVSIHLFMIMLIDQCWIVDSFSQRVNPDSQQHEIQLMLDYIDQEIERNQHHQVEQAMDQLTERMEDSQKSVDQISKHVQERIRYSIRVKRYKSAYNQSLQWINKHPNDIKVINLLGSVTTYMNRYREARDYLRTVYKSDPENEYFQERFLYVLRGLNDREEGLPLCHKILDDENSSQRLRLAAINGLIDLGMEAEAIPFFDLIKSYEKMDSLQHYVLGIAAFKENRFQNALEHLLLVERGDKRYSEAQNHIALCLFRQQNYMKAAHQNLTILSNNLYDQNAYVNLAQCLARLRNANASRLILSLQKQIEHLEMPMNEGDYYWGKGELVEYGRLHSISLNSKFKFQEAEQVLSTICEIYPESIPAKINLGKHYFTTLQSGKSEELFRVLLNQAEEYEKESIRVLLVEAMLRQGKIDDVLPLSGETNQDQLNALLGSYYLEMKHQPEQAIGYFETIDDATYSIQVAYAKCMSRLNQAEDALKLIDQIPDGVSYMDQQLIQVDCLLQLERIDEAKQMFEKVVQEHPDLPHLLQVPIQAKLSKALKKDDAEIWQEKAGQLNQLQNIIQAKVMEAQRIGLPDSAALFVELSELFEEIGDHDNALIYARRAYDAEPDEFNHLTRLISLLTGDEHVIERYHLIQKAIRTQNITQNFEQELGEVFDWLGLSQSKL